MAITLIDKIKPKNNGTFPLVDAEDVLMPDGSRLSDTEMGKQGEPGKDGKDGQNGTDGVSCTHVWNGTVLSVTSASGTSSADLKGADGKDGKDGEPGKNGTDGLNGEDGYTPVKGVDYYTDADKAEFETFLRTMLGENFVSMTQAEYDALGDAVDPNKYYMIVGDGE